MQRIYTHSNEHFQVFTTVLAPQGRFRYRAEAEKMVVVHSYRPHWPDELALSPGDVILVLSKHEEERWFGRLQDGQWGYFPSSCVMELSQANLPPKGPRRTLSQRITAKDGERSSGHILQTLRRGSRRGGGGVGLDVGQAERQGPFLVQRPQDSLPQPVTSQHQIHRSLSLLHRILSKCRKKSECQGTTNGAFESD
uniref:SH3 domain-containing protein n=1 Tax=Iconisemion striatum TaxID=60296 RepID=A0A1A7XRL9_9TELE